MSELPHASSRVLPSSWLSRCGGTCVEKSICSTAAQQMRAGFEHFCRLLIWLDKGQAPTLCKEVAFVLVFTSNWSHFKLDSVVAALVLLMWNRGAKQFNEDVIPATSRSSVKLSVASCGHASPLTTEKIKTLRHHPRWRKSFSKMFNVLQKPTVKVPTFIKTLNQSRRRKTFQHL